MKEPLKFNTYCVNDRIVDGAYNAYEKNIVI